MPVYVYGVDEHARIGMVDDSMTELHPAVAATSILASVP